MDRAGYVPIHLKEVASEIRKIHTETADRAKTSNEEIKKLIMAVCALPAERIEDYASLLSDRQLSILAEYITRNTFGFTMQNVKAVLECRINGEIFRTVYKGWQNEYQVHPVRECREFLLSAVRNHSEDIDYIKEHGLEIDLETWLSSKEIALEVCVSLLNFCGGNAVDIAVGEKYFDISGSVLSREATKLIYCYCEAAVYLNLTDVALHTKVKDFEVELVKKFLFNFLEKLTVKHLAAYNRIWSLARTIIGEPNSRQYNKFFSEAGKRAEILKNKYLEWRFINQIDIVFGGDYRSQFWKGKVLDYDATDYETKKSGEVLIMIFGNIYVLEFKRVGPVYFFTKEYYKENIERLFRTNIIYSVPEIRSILCNNHKDKEGFTNSYWHRGDWEYPVGRQLESLLKRYQLPR